MSKNNLKTTDNKKDYGKKNVFFMGLRILRVLVIVVAFYVIISWGYDFGYDLFAAPAVSAPPGREVTFTVAQGESSSSIINNLEEAGLINDKFAFRCQIIFYDKTLKPGKYTLNTSMKSKEILKQLDNGPEAD